MSGDRTTLWREGLSSLMRTAIGMLPPLIIAAWVWYARHDYTSRQHAEALGFLGVALLATLALLTLQPARYDRYGRLALLAFAVWAGGSSCWRVLSFFGWISAETRLMLNSIVAGVLGLSGVYVMFTRELVRDAWRYLMSGTTGREDG